MSKGDTQVGGTKAGEGNIIAFNAGEGVTVSTGDIRVPILGNSICSNGFLDIDLSGNNSVTANDPDDVDNGGNNLQKFPVIASAIETPTNTVLIGSLHTGSNSTYRIELFDNPTPDPSGYGEGQAFLGFTNVTTDSSGNASFSFTHPASLPFGHYVTVTSAGSPFIVSWPSATPDVFTLQSTTNLAPVIVWTTATQTLANNGTNRSATITPSVNERQRYFRLK